MTGMSKDLWTRIEPLLDQALELPPEERAAWLSRLRAQEPTLAAEVAALLASGSAPDDFLTPPGTDQVPAGTLSGLRIGSYVLDRPIGRGGMGTVWLATRSDGRFEGQVAIKLLNLALLGRAGEERFRQEGRLLARLTHANIARLIDAGVTAGGQPYLALEHVDGLSIDRYADEHRLPPEQRIRLMIEALTAVASAHANLIVHRDIKPSNILVGRDGAVKLLDFGIAKMLEEGRAVSGPSTLTDDSGRAMTPAYAAPEVILGEPVSTATDVYSAAVLLYQLLAGRHPTGADAARGPAALTAVVERDPPLLSAAVLLDTPAPATERAARLGATPERLARLYRGDLDHILARALRQRPEERYPSAAAFADDLARALRHEPVAAGPESAVYRTRKFLRRHRAAVVATAAVAASLIGGAGVAVNQMLIARRERDRAEDARKRSEASVAFESLIFRLLEPGAPAVTYEQLLDRGRTALENEYRGEPVARMQLGIQFAQNYLRGGNPGPAYDLIGRTVAIADSLGDPAWRARTRCELAAVHAVLRQPDSALALAAAGRRLLAAVRDPETGTLNACDYAEGNAWIVRREGDSAVARFQAVVRRYEVAGDTADSDYSDALNNLARALSAAGRPREALRITLRVIRAVRQGAGSDPVTPSILAYNAGVVYEFLGEYRQKRAFLAREIATSFARDSAALLPMVLFDYAMVLDRIGEPESALAWFGHAIANPQRIDSARILISHLTMSRLAEKLGRAGQAAEHRALARGYLGMSTRSPAGRGAYLVDRIQRTGAERNRARLLTEIGSALEALDYKPEGRSSPWVGPLLAATHALIANGLYPEAQVYAEHLLRIGSRDSLALGRSGLVGEALLLGAWAAAGQGDSARARDLLARALPPLGFGLGEDHRLTRAARALGDSLKP